MNQIQAISLVVILSVIGIFGYIIYNTKRQAELDRKAFPYRYTPEWKEMEKRWDAEARAAKEKRERQLKAVCETLALTVRNTRIADLTFADVEALEKCRKNGF